MTTEKEIEAKVDEMLIYLSYENEHFREAARKTLDDYYKDSESRLIVVEKVLAALQSPLPEVRKNAAALLGEWKVSRAVPGLIAISNDENADAKAAVRHSLALIAEKPENVKQHKELLVPVFIKFLEEKRDEWDARAFVKTLGHFKVAEAVPILADWLERSPGFSTFSNVATIEFELRDALVNIGKPSIPPLVGVLENGNDAQKAQAAQVLGGLKAVEAVPGLIKALDCQFYGCSTEAKRALQQIGKPAVPEMLKTFNALCEEYIRLWNTYSDKDRDKRQQIWDRIGIVAALLGEQKSKEAVPAMISLIKAGIEFDSVIRALGQIGDPRAVNPLIKAIPKIHGPTKGILFRSLGEIGDPRACEPLINQFVPSSSHPNEPVLRDEKTKSIREALIKIGEKAIPYLKAKGPKGTDLAYHSATLEEMKLVLVQIQGAYSLPELLEMLGKVEGELRDAVFDGIVAHGSSAVIPLLNKAVFEHKISPEECESLIGRIDKAAKLETGVVAKVEKPAGMERAAVPLKA